MGTHRFTRWPRPRTHRSSTSATRNGYRSPSRSRTRCSRSSCTASRARLLCTAASSRRCRGSTEVLAATQVMDEARHVEVFARYLDEKLGSAVPHQPQPQGMLDDILADSRWDIAYLGMQIMVEGLALAAFGMMQQMTTEPLLKKLLRYVMSDEARHVAFGVLSLQEFYAGLTDAELRERQEFAFDTACRLQRRFMQAEVWERMGVDPEAVYARGRPNPPEQQVFQQLLFSKIVPELQEARPARRRRRLVPRPVHRDRCHPVRGLGRHRRGIHDARRGHEGPPRLPLRDRRRPTASNRRTESTGCAVRGGRHAARSGRSGPRSFRDRDRDLLGVRRPHARRGRRPRQPARACVAGTGRRRRRRRSRCCAATARSSSRRSRPRQRAGLPAHDGQLAPHRRRSRATSSTTAKRRRSSPTRVSRATARPAAAARAAADGASSRSAATSRASSAADDVARRDSRRALDDPDARRTRCSTRRARRAGPRACAASRPTSRAERVARDR